MDVSAIFAGLATGMVLGLFGSGGSIIAMPALMYLLHVEPKSAIAMSLGVVAVTAVRLSVECSPPGRRLPRPPRRSGVSLQHNPG